MVQQTMSGVPPIPTPLLIHGRSCWVRLPKESAVLLGVASLQMDGRGLWVGLESHLNFSRMLWLQIVERRLVDVAFSPTATEIRFGWVSEGALTLVLVPYLFAHAIVGKPGAEYLRAPAVMAALMQCPVLVLLVQFLLHPADKTQMSVLVTFIFKGVTSKSCPFRNHGFFNVLLAVWKTGIYVTSSAQQTFSCSEKNFF